MVFLQEGDQYLDQLVYFIISYSTLLVANFTFVFCCMALVYYKSFRRIRQMILTQGRGLFLIFFSFMFYFVSENINENTPLYGATLAMILAGHKYAKKRVFIFFSVYVITGTMGK